MAAEGAEFRSAIRPFWHRLGANYQFFRAHDSAKFLGGSDFQL
jgi:hypothetical protein